MKATRFLGLLCAALMLTAALAITPVTTALAASRTISVDGTVQLNTLGLASGDTITIEAGRTVTLVGDGTTYVDLRIVSGAGVRLTLQDVKISNGIDASPLSFVGEGNKLALAGVNVLHNSDLAAAV